MGFMLCGYIFDDSFLFEIVMPVYHYSVQTVCKCYQQTSKRKQLPFHELPRLLLALIMILLVLKNIINIFIAWSKSSVHDFLKDHIILFQYSHILALRL